MSALKTSNLRIRVSFGVKYIFTDEDECEYDNGDIY